MAASLLNCGRIINSGQILTTSADVTLNGGLIRELPPNPLNSGLGIILIWPDKLCNFTSLKRCFSLRVMEFPSGWLPEPKLWMAYSSSGGWVLAVTTKNQLIATWTEGSEKNWLASIHPRMARASPCIISIQHASLETSHHKGFSIQRQAPLDPLTSRCKNLTSKIQPTLRPADQLQAMMRRRFFFGHILLALRI